MNPETPYADLTPERVLDAVEDLGLRCDGRLLQLNSFENRVFRVGLDDGSACVAKFYRAGRWSDAAIGDEHGFTLELVAAGVGAVAPWVIDGATLHHRRGQRLALFPLQRGRPPELESPAALQALGRLLGALHRVGAASAYRDRPALDIVAGATAARDTLLSGSWIPASLLPRWQTVTGRALDAMAARVDAVGALATLRLHGDVHPGNLLVDDSGPHLVDFDDSCCGPAVQDLWMLLSGDAAQQRSQLGALLAGYEDWRDFDDAELGLIETLRTLRLLQHGAWIAQRWHDPAFPAAFPAFGSADDCQQRLAAIEEQLPMLQLPAR